MAQAQPGFADRDGEAAWRAAVDTVLKGADFEAALVGRTADAIPVAPLYPPAEPASPVGIGARPRRLLQRADHPDPAEANRLALADLEGGADGLVLSFAGAVSARGFGLRPAAAELDRALSGVSLGPVGLRIEAAPFGGRAARLAVTQMIEARRLDPAGLDIDFGLDSIGSMARSGAATAPWPALSARTVAVVDALLARGFAGPLLRADGRPYHEAGASEAQELASVVATGLAYLRALEGAGHDLEAARGLIGFTLAADADLFLGLAKIRALRQLWAGVETACGLVPKPIRLHVETAWRTLARRDPWTNLIRATLGCAAAILGGADGVTVLPFTTALGLPDGFARRLARNTHLVLVEEASLGRVADPAAGAGGFEALTQALCEAAWTLLQESERAGGLPLALASNIWQGRIAETAARRRAALAEGRAAIVGTTVFPDPQEVVPAVLDVPAGAPVEPGLGPGALRFEPLRPGRDAAPFEEGAAR